MNDTAISLAQLVLQFKALPEFASLELPVLAYKALDLVRQMEKHIGSQDGSNRNAWS